MSKKCCKRNCKCNSCKKSPQYCGDDLLCIDVKQGDRYDDIFKKINEFACSTDGDYFFEENKDCNNGGIIVKNNKGDIVFEQCYSCCDCSELGVNINTVPDDRNPSGTTITTATATGGSGDYSFDWTMTQYEEPNPNGHQITFNYTQTTTTLTVERLKPPYNCLWNLRVKDNNTNCFIDRAYLISR